MGKTIFDKYSILHLVVGCIFRYFNFSLESLFILHTIFELTENTQIGMKIINDYITIWPGGKDKADSHLNSFSDIIFSLIGWYIMDKTNNNIIILLISLVVIAYFWLV